jgi:hypothetical protein
MILITIVLWRNTQEPCSKCASENWAVTRKYRRSWIVIAHRSTQIFRCSTCAVKSPRLFYTTNPTILSIAFQLTDGQLIQSKNISTKYFNKRVVLSFLLLLDWLFGATVGHDWTVFRHFNFQFPFISDSVANRPKTFQNDGLVSVIWFFTNNFELNLSINTWSCFYWLLSKLECLSRRLLFFHFSRNNCLWLTQIQWFSGCSGRISTFLLYIWNRVENCNSWLYEC